MGGGFTFSKKGGSREPPEPPWPERNSETSVHFLFINGGNGVMGMEIRHTPHGGIGKVQYRKILVKLKEKLYIESRPNSGISIAVGCIDMVNNEKPRK